MNYFNHIYIYIYINVYIYIFVYDRNTLYSIHVLLTNIGCIYINNNSMSLDLVDIYT